MLLVFVSIWIKLGFIPLSGKSALLSSTEEEIVFTIVGHSVIVDEFNVSWGKLTLPAFKVVMFVSFVPTLAVKSETDEFVASKLVWSAFKDKDVSISVFVYVVSWFAFKSTSPFNSSNAVSSALRLIWNPYFSFVYIKKIFSINNIIFFFHI